MGRPQPGHDAAHVLVVLQHHQDGRQQDGGVDQLHHVGQRAVAQDASLDRAPDHGLLALEQPQVVGAPVLDDLRDPRPFGDQQMQRADEAVVPQPRIGVLQETVHQGRQRRSRRPLRKGRTV